MRIGVTEYGDPSLDFSWVNKVDTVDGVVLITKNLTDAVIQKVAPNLDKFIFHITCTGWGNTIIEPNIPKYTDQLNNAKKLVDLGVDVERIVIRVDPIIPSPRCLGRARRVFDYATALGFKRFRVSLLDAYPHVRERFAKANIVPPYLNNFSPTDEMVDNANKMFAELKAQYPDIVIESCAEKDLVETEKIGCVSKKDVELLNLDTESCDEVGFQRKTCLCCSAKTELLEKKERCPYKCLYCYWRD